MSHIIMLSSILCDLSKGGSAYYFFLITKAWSVEEELKAEKEAWVISMSLHRDDSNWASDAFYKLRISFQNLH